MDTLTVYSQAIPQQAENDTQVVQMWLQTSNSAATRAAYDRERAKFYAYIFPKKLQSVTVGDIQEYKQYLIERLSDAAVARSVSAVKSLMSFAFNIGYTRFNPGRVVPVPKSHGAVAERILSRSEVNRLIKAGNCFIHRLMIKVLYLTGCRREELQRMNFTDMAQQDGGNWQVRVTGKGNKQRYLLITDRLAAEMLSLRPDDGSGPIFASPRGGPYSLRAIDAIVESASRRAGLGKAVSPHWLRHSHATHSVSSGCELHVLQRSLGHSSLATTGRYLHISPGECSSSFLDEEGIND